MSYAYRMEAKLPHRCLQESVSFQNRVLERISSARSGSNSVTSGGGDVVFFDQGEAAESNAYGFRKIAGLTASKAEPMLTSTVLSVSSPLARTVRTCISLRRAAALLILIIVNDDKDFLLI